ncbi:MAG: Mov34/MPN/PAD-1 family protein [Chloroflexi bacterium]|nr:Mov34/MPN/PAD-1 family protein [Chloroflexota bacterium]
MSALDTLLAMLPTRRPRLRVLGATGRPAHLETLLVPRTIVGASLTHLQAGGARGCEEFAFWSGHVVGDRIGIVGRAFHPRTSQGYGHVMIDDDAQLLSMTELVHEHDELVLCQLHTHPADAWHSPTDDQGAFTDEVGFLSLVLPSFASGGLETAEAFRRTQQGWVHEGRAVTTGLVQVFGDLLRYDGANWHDD